MTHLVLVSFVWAFSFPLIKGYLAGIDPSLVSFVRMALSLLVFLPLLRVRGPDRSVVLRLVGIGAVQFGFMYVAYIASFRYLPAHTVALLTTTTPLFVTLFGDLLSRRFNRLFLLAALLAVAGGTVVKYPDQSLHASIAGVLLVQASNIAFALGQVMYRNLAAKRPAWKDRPVFALLYLGAVVFTGGFSLVTTSYSELRLDASQLLVLAYLGIVGSGLCFFLWNRGARFVNQGTLSAMNNLKIPLGIAASLVLLHEKTDLLRLGIGTCLMLVAAYLCERRNKGAGAA